MEHIDLTEEQMAQYVAILNDLEQYRDLTDDEKERIVRSILDKPYMDLRSDWAFKHVFQDLELMKMLLNDLLPEDIQTVEHLKALPNEIDKMRPDDKNIIMDVLVKTGSGEEIIVEMQRKKKKSFKNRMVYYGASKIHGQMKKKDPYDKLKPVYVICFMDFTFEHQTEQLIYHYSLREKTSGEPYGKQLSILLCELPRMKKTSMDGLNPVESWFFILENMRKFAGKPEDMGSRYAPVAEAARMNILPTGDRIKYFYNMVTDEERLDIGAAYYEDGFKAGRAEGEAKGRAEGKAEGKAEGEAEKQAEIAKAMLAEGLAVDLIVKCTGLNAEEIEALRQN